jgi:hypothetical protein
MDGLSLRLLAEAWWSSLCVAPPLAFVGDGTVLLHVDLTQRGKNEWTTEANERIRRKRG